MAVDGNAACGADREGNLPGTPIGNGNTIEVQIVGGKFGSVHHTVAIAVQEVLGLHHAFEISGGRYQLTAKGPVGAGQGARKSAPPGIEIALLVHGEVAISDVDGALFHGQRAGLHVQGEVPADVLEHTRPNDISAQYARIDIVGYDRAVHGDGQPIGLSAVIGVPQTIHVPLPELIGLGVVPDIGNIQSV